MIGSPTTYARGSATLGLAAHTDGAIHAGADDTLAIGMQQGPRPEQQDCGGALLWVPRGGGFSPRCAAVIADGAAVPLWRRCRA